jgi:anti-sigma factor RsiW
MSCEDVEADLDAWGVGLLSGSRRREIESHLGYCGACAEASTSLRALVGRLAALPASVDAAALEARVLARAFARPARPRRPWSGFAAAASLLLLLSVPERTPAPLLPTPAIARAERPAPPPLALAPRWEVEAPILEDVGSPPPPPPARTEDVASFTWEEAMAAPSPWDVGTRESFPAIPDAAPLGGPVFAGWFRDEDLGGAAVAGLSLGF